MFYCVQGYIHRIARNCSASGKWASTLHWELSYFLSTQTWLHLHTSRWHATSAQQHTEGTGEPSTTRASLFLTDFLVCCVEKVLDSILFFDFAVLRALCRILTSTYHISSQISSTNYLAQLLIVDYWHVLVNTLLVQVCLVWIYIYRLSFSLQLHVLFL